MLPLDGYTVIDLSSGIAGAYCTKLLADGGATVVKVEPPEGDPLRRWSASGAEIKAGDDGALFSFLAGAKDSVVADPDADAEFVDGLLGDADAVVWSRGSRLAEHPAFAPDEIERRHPHLTVTTITPFGLDGPWADRPATEFTVQAWSGGVIGLGRGAQDRPPLFVAGQIGEWLAGAYAAAGTMAVQSGVVDVSMLEVETLCLTYYSVSFHRCPGPPVPRPSTAHHSGCRNGGRRSGGAGLRDRAAVVRPVRDDGPRRVDRRGVATLHHRTGQHPRQGDLRVGAREHASTRSSTCRPRSGFPTRRSETAPTSPRSTSSPNGARSSPIRATGSLSPVLPTAPRRRSVRAPRAAPRLGEHTDDYRRNGHRSPRRDGQSFRRACRSRACASWT